MRFVSQEAFTSDRTKRKISDPQRQSGNRRITPTRGGMRVKLRVNGLKIAGIQGPKARFMAALGIALGNGVTMNIEG